MSVLAVAAKILIGLIALEHLWFLVLEMFLFTKPIGLKTFRMKAEFAAQAASLAKNQGLYNGFLAAGLIWSLVAGEPLATPLRYFFLGCVAVAGVYGAVTVSRAILVGQALPAVIALGLVFLSSPSTSKSTSTTTTTTTVASLAPWEPADEGFRGCEGACGLRATGPTEGVVAQPGAGLGQSVYCPVSGVVFPVKADSPQRDVSGKPVYFCCDGCANHFSENRAHLIGLRKLASAR